uniref:Carbonic anhydrase n=1 Tax=Alexandrium monilatum TaxID=311494 RepID=A0A7S4Q9A3_9DINO
MAERSWPRAVAARPPLLLAVLASLAAGALLEVERAEDFEREVFSSKHVWAVGFVNSQRPNDAFEAVLAKLPDLVPAVRWGRLDVTVSGNSPIASELNVRHDVPDLHGGASPCGQQKKLGP